MHGNSGVSAYNKGVKRKATPLVLAKTATGGTGALRAGNSRWPVS